MIKISYLYKNILLITFPIYSFTLGENVSSKTLNRLTLLATQKVFDFESDPFQRKRLKKQLKDPNFRINAFDFNGLVLQGTNLSDFPLSGINFSGSTLNHINFNKADLRDIRLRNTVLNNVNLRNTDLRLTFSNPNYFSNCKLNNVDLNDALLYGDTEENYFYLKGKSGVYNLLHQYSDLMKKARLKKLEGDKLKSDLLVEHAKQLSNLFYIIPLDLRNMDLTGFDLTNLNLENAKLNNVYLSEVRLSENVIIPRYEKNNTRVLFDRWNNGSNEEKKFYQVLVNAGFNLFLNKFFNRVKNINWDAVNLKGADLSGVDLSDCKLIGINLKDIDSLYGAYLSNSRFSENVSLPYYSYNDRTPLIEDWLSSSEEKKEIYKTLIKKRFNMVIGVNNDLLRTIDWGSKNLKNVNFNNGDFRRVDLRNVDLKQVTLYNAQLQKAILDDEVTVPNHNIDLFNLWINGSLRQQEVCQQLVNATFNLFVDIPPSVLGKGLELKKDLRNADLTGADLSNSDLSNADLQNAILKDIEFRHDIRDARIPNIKNFNLRGTNIGGVTLSTSATRVFKLPSQCADEDLIHIYHVCEDKTTKPYLAAILEAKGISLR